MTKNHFFIFTKVLQFIRDLEIEWKRINEIWLIKQEKKDKKKKSRLEKLVKENDDNCFKFLINKFNDKNNFISFENKNENEKTFCM